MSRKKTCDDVLYKSPSPTTRHKYVGIEIEFLCPIDTGGVAQAIVDSPLAVYCSIATDSSVDVDDEFFEGDMYGLEMRVLLKQNEVATVVPQVMEFIRNLGGYVNDSCGLHVHLDMRHRNPQKAYRNLFQAQTLLYRMCDPKRRLGEFCQELDEDVNTLEGFFLTYGGTKYWGINATPLHSRNTLEVRIHHATLRATQIVHWVKLLTLLVDARPLTERIASIAQLRDHVKLPKPAIAHIKRRVIKYIDEHSAIETCA